MGWYGPHSEGPNWLVLAADRQYAFEFELARAERLSKLVAYLDGGGAPQGEQELRGTVYDAMTGELMADCDVAAIEAGAPAAWYDLRFTKPDCLGMLLEPGGYVVGLHAGSVGGVARIATTPGSGGRWADVYADGPGQESPLLGRRYADEVMLDGPALFWHLNETAGTTAQDASLNNRVGTYGGTFTLNQPGLLPEGDACATFNEGHVGSTYKPYALGSTRTFEAWITRTTPNTYPALFRSSLVNAGPSLTVPDNGSVNWEANAGFGGQSWPAGTVAVDGPVSHLVLVYDDATRVAELFINGVSKGTRTLTAGWGYPVAAPNATLDCPGNTNNPAWDWTGRVDEVAVYEYALAPERIAAHYEAAFPGGYAGLVLKDAPALFWRAGEASGTTAQDATPYNRDGTIAGGVTLGEAGALPGDTDTAFKLNGVDGAITAAYGPWTGATSAIRTVELWAKRRVSTSTPDAFWGIIAGSGGYGLRIMSASGDVAINGITAVGGTWPAAIPDIGVWTHVAAICNGATGNVELFVNGTSLGSKNVGAGNTPQGPFRVGESDNLAPSDFDGWVDEIAVFEGALSAARIQAHYQAGPTPVAKPIELPSLAMVTSDAWDPVAAGADDEHNANFGFYTAQAVFGQSQPDVRTQRLATCEWYGGRLSEQQGSACLVRSDGPLAELIGERLLVTNLATRRSVRVYCHAQNSEVQTDISLSRRAFQAIGYLATEELDVTVEALV